MSHAEDKQNMWSGPSGYILSMLGSAIGFANILSFGSECYRNGGSAFLFPFFTALFILGIPMLILEGIIGKSTQSPLVTSYGIIAGKPGKVAGWLSILAVLTIAGIYTVLTGWSIGYTAYSLFYALPSDPASFFVNDFLQASSGITEWGGISWPVMISTIFVIILTWSVVHKNIQSGIEKWCSVFLPLLAVLILSFTTFVFTLPGAYEGFIRYLTPDFSKVWDFQLWKNVFGQLFFSLSLGIGIVVGYSRHTGSNINIRRAMYQVAMGDFIISFISGLTIFGCLGYMSENFSIPFEELAATTSSFEIGYIVFPTIISSFGPLLATLLAPLFFFCIFIAGITGVFSIVESIAGNIEIEYNQSRNNAVTITMVLIALIAIPFCLGNGTAIIDALADMVIGNNMLIGAILQIIVFFYLTDRFTKNKAWFNNQGKRTLSFYSLKYLSPIILVTTLYNTLSQQVLEGFTTERIVSWSWLAVALVISTILSSMSKTTR